MAGSYAKYECRKKKSKGYSNALVQFYRPRYLVIYQITNGNDTDTRQHISRYLTGIALLNLEKKKSLSSQQLFCYQSHLAILTGA